jgi:DNA polymerase III delta prime subunit
MQAFQDEKTMAKFGRLGISEQELQGTTNVLELLAKKTGSGTAANSALGDIIGMKNVGAFRGAQDSMSNIADTIERLAKAGQLVDPKAVEKLAEAKDLLAGLMDEISTELLPTVATVFSMLVNALMGVKDVVVGIIETIKGLGFWKTALGMATGGYGITGPAMNYATDKYIERQNRILKNAAARKAARANLSTFGTSGGPNVIDQMIGYANQLQKIDEDRQKWSMAGRSKGDEWTNVGNFLGEGGTIMSSLAQQQLETAKQQLATLNSMNTYLEAIAGSEWGVKP